MPSTIPPKLPYWASSDPNPNILEPGEGKKQQGWVPGEQPPAAYFNYWMNLVGQWVEALRDTGMVQAAADAEAFALSIAAQTPSNPNKGAADFHSAVQVSFDPVTGWAVWWTYTPSFCYVGRENVLVGSAASTVGAASGLASGVFPTCAGFDGVEHVVCAASKVFKVAWAADLPSVGAEITGGLASYDIFAASPTTRVFMAGSGSSVFAAVGPVGGTDLPNGVTGITSGGDPHAIVWDTALEHFVYVSSNGTTWLSADGIAWHAAADHGLAGAVGGFGFSAAYFAPLRAVVVCGRNVAGNYTLRYTTDGATTWHDAGLADGRVAASGAYQEVFASQHAVYVRGYPRAGSSAFDRIMYCGALGDPAAWKFFELPTGTTGTETTLTPGQFCVLTGTGDPAAPRRTTAMFWPKTLDGLVQMSKKVTVP